MEGAWCRTEETREYLSKCGCFHLQSCMQSKLVMSPPVCRKTVCDRYNRSDLQSKQTRSLQLCGFLREQVNKSKPLLTAAVSLSVGNGKSASDVQSAVSTRPFLARMVHADNEAGASPRPVSAPARTDRRKHPPEGRRLNVRVRDPGITCRPHVMVGLHSSKVQLCWLLCQHSSSSPRLVQPHSTTCIWLSVVQQ